MNLIPVVIVCSLLVVQPVNKEAILETILSEPKASKIPMQFKSEDDATKKKGAGTPDDVLLKQGIEFYNAEFYERALQAMESLQKN